METYLLGSIVAILMLWVRTTKKEFNDGIELVSEIIASALFSWLGAIITVREIQRINKQG